MTTLIGKFHHRRPCPYCGILMSMPPCADPGMVPTRDHVVPKSRGGPDEACNILVVCSACNNLKGDLTLDEWLVYLDEDQDGRAPHIRDVLATKPHLRRLAKSASPWMRDDLRFIGTDAIRAEFFGPTTRAGAIR